MSSYQHLEDRKEEIIKSLHELDSYDTLAKAKHYLFNIYYRECESIPNWLKRYSSEEAREYQLVKYIKTKLRCPGCLDKVEKYFKNYEQYIRRNLE